MVCLNSCLISASLYAGILYVQLSGSTSVQKLTKLFSKEQLTRYHDIALERREIYIKGLILGAVIGIVLLFLVDGTPYSQGCIFSLSMGVVSYLYYTLSPKQPLMIAHLQKDQIPAWMEVRKEMSMKYHIGTLLGAGAAFLLGQGLCK